MIMKGIFKLDTRAQVNIIPKSEILKSNEKPKMQANYTELLMRKLC